jgi:hypothetical protein
VWDDDDWYHPERMCRQLAALSASRKSAVLLSRLLIYDAGAGQAYLGCDRLWENSLMFDRRRIRELGIAYPAMNRSEDYHFVNDLLDRNLVFPLLDPTLYVYVANGANVSGAAHFAALQRRSIALPPSMSDQVREALASDPRRAGELIGSDEFLTALPYIARSALPRL